MKISNILYFLFTILTGALMASFIPPVIVNAAPFQEVYLTEESAGAPRTEQRFVIVDTSGAVTEYVYNHKGLLIKETNPLGEVTAYEYDVLDRLSKTVTPDGTVTKYTYDVAGNVAKITAQKITGEAETLQYVYTPEGYLAAAISETTADEFTYTQSGKIASVTRNGKYRLELFYDDAGNMIELRELRLDVRIQDSVTNYAYDSFNRLVKVVQDGVLLAEYSYHDNGRLKQQVDGTGSITEYTYDNQNNLVSMETKTSGGMVSYREESSYNENRSVITRAVTGMVPEASGTAGISSYTYDLCNKLVTERIGGAVTYYVYDAIGNLIKKNAPDGTTSYSYDAFNQLTKVVNPYGVCQENEYDALGIRSVLTENGVATEYMTYNGMVLAAYNTAGERTEHYSYGKKILARE